MNKNVSNPCYTRQNCLQVSLITLKELKLSRYNFEKFLDLVSYKIRNEFSKIWVPIFVHPKALHIVKIGLY